MNGIGNTVFRPSKVEDQINDYLNQPHWTVSSLSDKEIHE